MDMGFGQVYCKDTQNFMVKVLYSMHGEDVGVTTDESFSHGIT